MKTIAAAFIMTSIIAFLGGMIVRDQMIAIEKKPIFLDGGFRPSGRPPAHREYTLPLQFASDLIYYCDETGMPVWMMARQMDKEAWWNPHPRPSSAGAEGMAQIMPGDNARVLAKLYNDGNPIDPYDPVTAIRIMVRYTADIYYHTGDWRRAVGGYNAGPAKTPSQWKPETVGYVREVLMIGGDR